MNFRHFLFLLLIAVTSFIACTKSINSKPAITTGNEVRIRILNKTALPATDAVLGNQSYGTIQSGGTTGYHSFTGLIAAPAISFYNNSTEVSLIIGVCGTPMPPELEGGNYLYTLIADSTSPYGSGYTFSFAKE